MGPVMAPAGTVAVMVVLFTGVKVAATLLVNFTPVTLPPLEKLVPVIVTVLPTLPTPGLMPLMAGQVSPGVMLKLASEMSKKMFPTASTLTRAVEVGVFGTLIVAAPLLGVLDARVNGKLFPPSMESNTRTFVQLTGTLDVLATLHVTV